MPITEPMTLATDWLLAAVVFGLGMWLWRRRGDRRSVSLWAIVFFATSLAALTGGAWHGFHSGLDAVVAEGLWKLTTFSIGVASFALVGAAAFAGFTGSWRGWILGLGGLKLAAFVGWMAFHDDFRSVIVDYLASILVVAIVAAIGWRRGERWAPWIVAGLAVSLGAAGIQASGLDLARWFNHNDLYHVIQIGAFVLLARGGSLLRDRDGA